ncbi:MAG: methionyl-tRNA formyltransferase [Clostridia bacterium]|nr:methionyl-tRNA formyltransferase [Clostridia bacterium]
MRVIYLGTPEFAVQPLNYIAQAHQVTAVITQPDKVGSRNKVTNCPVKQRAIELGIPVMQFDNINKQGIEQIKSLNPDIMITCAYGQLLSQQILDIAPHGVLNIHASLLPKYRGAAPINWAIINGEMQSGISIMRTVKRLDAGDVLLQESVNISQEHNAGLLSFELSIVASKLIIIALALIDNQMDTYTPQDEHKATFCGKITTQMELIDWTQDARSVSNLVRGLSPSPCCYTYLNGKRIKINHCVPSACPIKGNVGEIICTKSKITVCCGSGSVDLIYLLFEGGKIMTARDCINGRKITSGMVLRNE